METQTQLPKTIFDEAEDVPWGTLKQVIASDCPDAVKWLYLRLIAAGKSYIVYYISIDNSEEDMKLLTVLQQLSQLDQVAVAQVQSDGERKVYSISWDWPGKWANAKP